jgi:hypothetical protein
MDSPDDLKQLRLARDIDDPWTADGFFAADGTPVWNDDGLPCADIRKKIADAERASAKRKRKHGACACEQPPERLVWGRLCPTCRRPRLD